MNSIWKVHLFGCLIQSQCQELCNCSFMPVLSEYITSVAAQKCEDHFFFNKVWLAQYTSTQSETTRSQLPGSGYFKKITEFFNEHYEVGELYMEYKRDSCLKKAGKKCQYCTNTDWSGPHFTRIPRPWPDYDTLPDHHYLHVSQTPTTSSDGKDRKADDFQPRANLKMLYEEDAISLNNSVSVKQFCDKFIVTEKLVREHLNHLQNMKHITEIRTRERKKDKDQMNIKTYDDYKWNELVEKGTIGKLLVQELNKYLTHHNLSMIGKKKDKIRRIIAHVYRCRDAEFSGLDIDYTSDSESESDNDDIEDTCSIVSTASETQSESEEEDQQSNAQQGQHILTRSGRISKRKIYDDYFYD